MFYKILKFEKLSSEKLNYSHIVVANFSIDFKIRFWLGEIILILFHRLTPNAPTANSSVLSGSLLNMGRIPSLPYRQ